MIIKEPAGWPEGSHLILIIFGPLSKAAESNGVAILNLHSHLILIIFGPLSKAAESNGVAIPNDSEFESSTAAHGSP